MLAAAGERRGFVDADGSTPIEEMDRLEAVVDGGADIAVGSRALDPSMVEALLHRRLLGAVFRRLVSTLAVRTVEDTQCGFKLFRSSAAIRVFAEQIAPRFAFDVEVLARAERLGLTVIELPVRWREQPGSKVHLIGDSVNMAVDVIRIRRRLGPPASRLRRTGAMR
jgi:dolichyl-phosphate beta-glucosyltransferase